MKKRYESPVCEVYMPESICLLTSGSIEVGGGDEKIEDSGDIRTREFNGEDDWNFGW